MGEGELEGERYSNWLVSYIYIYMYIRLYL